LEAALVAPPIALATGAIMFLTARGSNRRVAMVFPMS